jgi:hypothetical protein
MTMAAGDGSTDAENGVKMAARDRFHPAGGPAQPDPEPGAGPEQGAAPGPGADREPGHGSGLEVYGDSQYGSGQARADYQRAATTR